MTLKHITDPELRQALARELAALRKTMKDKKIPMDDYWRGVMFGMESMAWSLQRARNAQKQESTWEKALKLGNNITSSIRSYLTLKIG